MYTKMKDATTEVFSNIQFAERRKKIPYELKKVGSVIAPISEEQRGELLTMTANPA